MFVEMSYRSEVKLVADLALGEVDSWQCCGCNASGFSHAVSTFLRRADLKRLHSPIEVVSAVLGRLDVYEADLRGRVLAIKAASRFYALYPEDAPKTWRERDAATERVATLLLDRQHAAKRRTEQRRRAALQSAEDEFENLYR